MASTPYRLYFDHLTSAFVPHVMLDELGVAYDLVHVDTSAGAHKSPEFRALNPNMLIPTLQLADGRSFGENGAILLVRGDLHPETRLAPAPQDADRPAYPQWLFALATTGHTTMRRYAYPEEYTTWPEAEAATREAAWTQLCQFFDVLEHAIAGDPWFMGRGFGPLDIYTAMICLVLTAERQMEVLATRPNLARLHRAAHARDSIRRLRDFYRLPRG